MKSLQDRSYRAHIHCMNEWNQDFSVGLSQNHSSLNGKGIKKVSFDTSILSFCSPPREFYILNIIIVSRIDSEIDPMDRILIALKVPIFLPVICYVFAIGYCNS